ncbi:MAG: pyruvate synthase subunit PorB [Nitrososphaerales archaeon]
MSAQAFRSIKDIPLEEYFTPGHRACQGCGETIAVRHILKAAGPDVIVVNATGCLEVISSPYPYTAWAVPWYHVAFENAAAVASGIEAALKVLTRKNLISGKKIHVVCFAGDGGTADIGFQALSGALERGHDFLYVCLDNEAYMNTGIQRSSSTPYGAWTTTSPPGKVKPAGQMTYKKDLPSIFAAHGIPYVATATVAYPLDLINKAKKGLEVEGPAYLHVYTPCSPGWRVPSEKVVQVSRLGVQTGMFLIYEVENGQLRLTVKPSRRKPVTEYLKMQGRFRHLSDEDVERIQRLVDERCAKFGLPPLEAST